MMLLSAAPEQNTSSARNAGTATHGWRRWWKPTVLVLALALLASTPWTAPPLLAHLEYFRLKRIEFEGVQYARVNELRAAAGVDSSWSIWNDVDTVAASVARHPMIASATVERRFPSGLLIRLTERVPVAQVSQKGILVPMDADGRQLPIDLARTPIDVPVAPSADSTILRLLDELRQLAPAIFDRIVSARRVARDHLLFDLEAFVVRTRDDVTGGRFRDILPVEADLSRNRLRAIELDLRFQDQVIVRQP
jgi:cell division protein FtsQ